MHNLNSRLKKLEKSQEKFEVYVGYLNEDGSYTWELDGKIVEKIPEKSLQNPNALFIQIEFTGVRNADIKKQTEKT